MPEHGLSQTEAKTIDSIIYNAAASINNKSHKTEPTYFKIKQ